MNQENQTNKYRLTYTGAGMGLGLVLGGITGLLIDNLAFSAGSGMILGLAIGYALEKQQHRKKTS